MSEERVDGERRVGSEASYVYSIMYFRYTEKPICRNQSNICLDMSEKFFLSNRANSRLTQ